MLPVDKKTGDMDLKTGDVPGFFLAVRSCRCFLGVLKSFALSYKLNKFKNCVCLSEVQASSVILTE